MMATRSPLEEDQLHIQRAKELVDSFQDVDDKYPTTSQLNLAGEACVCVCVVRV